MSMEQELGRIADALERIEAKLGAPLKIEEGKPVAKRKSTKAVKETPATPVEDADFGGGNVAANENTESLEPSMTPEELLVHCNTAILAIKDVAKRGMVVKKVKGILDKSYGVSSVKAIPADKVNSFKEAFEEVMQGV